MASLRLVAGLTLLILGRQLFWVSVFVLGFVMGMDLGTQLVPDTGERTVLLVALLAGILGAGLAYFFTTWRSRPRASWPATGLVLTWLVR